MNDSSDAEVAEALGVGSPEQQEQDTPDVEAPESEAPEVPDEPADIDSLPTWAQAEIRRARREAAASRVKVREAQQAGQTEAQRIRAEVAAEFAQKMAASEIRGALGDLKPEHVDDLIEDLNLGRFVTEEHDVDRAAVKAFAARILGARRARADVGHGEGTNGQPRKKTTGEQFADTISGMFTT